jgi:integrase
VQAIGHVVTAAAKRSDLKSISPHDLRRTCGRLRHLAGEELEQIQFLLGACIRSNRRRMNASISLPGKCMQ